MNCWKIIIFLLLLGCNPKSKCDLWKVLFPAPPEHGWVLPMRTIWVHSDSIQDVICAGDNGWLYLKVKERYIKYELTDLRNSCANQPPFCYPMKRRDKFEILVNSNNNILVESRLSSIPQIDSLFQLVYLNPNNSRGYITNPSNSAISLKWDIQASKDTVECIIYELMSSYQNSIKTIYDLKYGECFCDSILTNIKEVQDDYPFNLQLRFVRELTLGGRMPPPLPPPAWYE